MELIKKFPFLITNSNLIKKCCVKPESLPEPDLTIPKTENYSNSQDPLGALYSLKIITFLLA
jgi:hypothetical protein